MCVKSTSMAIVMILTQYNSAWFEACFQAYGVSRHAGRGGLSSDIFKSISRELCSFPERCVQKSSVKYPITTDLPTDSSPANHKDT